MKLAAVIILTVFLIFFVVQVYLFWSRTGALGVQYEKLQTELKKTENEHLSLQADLNYFMNPANLEKEVRARFNYRSSDEKMIIIVPAAASSSGSSAR